MNKQDVIEAELQEEKGLAIQSPNDLEKPAKDTEFAEKAATFLVDIIKKNKWSRNLGGESDHIQYEGWQTAGKYYGYTVKTFDAEYVEFGAAKGFKAQAVVVNERTGMEVGGAEAFCLSDEPKWSLEPHKNKYDKTVPGKPLFQLASMAQTRAGSKALRQILGFVVALAGYSPTPVEEMEEVNQQQPGQIDKSSNQVTNEKKVTEKQVSFIQKLLKQKGHTEKSLETKYKVSEIGELASSQASTIIANLLKLDDVTIH